MAAARQDPSFPPALFMPGPRDVPIQCFIKRDKSNMTYHLFLSLTPAALVGENRKFLLSAKRTRRITCTEYVISMDAENISRSSNAYIGKLRSNFLGTKFILYDTQPPHPGTTIPLPPGRSKHFLSKKVSPTMPRGSYNIAQITYELNTQRTRAPRRMHCTMHTIPNSALEPGGTVPGQQDHLLPPHSLEDSFRTMSFSKSLDHPTEFATSADDSEKSKMPLVMKNKPPRWHEQFQCWCLNFRGRVTIASVKNFQLIAAQQPAAGNSQPPAAGAFQLPPPPEVILQFGKVGKDEFTMDYRYPLTAFQAFAICLSSFGTKLACE